LYERVAKQIPRGIQSHNEVCKVGYKLAVQEVGIKEAQQLDTKFAVKLMSSYYQQHIDEGVGSFLGKAAGHVVGGLGAAWRDAKKGYADAKSSWSSGAPAPETPAPAATTAPAASTPVSTASASTPVSTTSAGQTTPASTATPPAGNKPAPAADPALDGIMQQVQGLDANQKKELLAKLQGGGEAPTPTTPAAVDPGTDHGLGKQSDGKFITPGQQFDTETGKPLAAPEAPTGQGVEIDPAKAAADKAAKNQADADQRNADIEKTKQANAAAAAADEALRAKVAAAKAKPGFQQSPEDKLAIKAGAAKGIHESKKKKKKKLAEFKSKFLGMII
jgi:hypothetical protein